MFSFSFNLFFCLFLSVFSSSFLLHAVIIICTTSTYSKNYHWCNKCIPFGVSVSSSPFTHHPSCSLSHSPPLALLPLPFSLLLDRPRYLIKRECICERNDNFTLRSCWKNINDSLDITHATLHWKIHRYINHHIRL